ncbi:MAG: excinuclease ABC subunit UvrA [Opitutales bacterium]
MDVGGNATHIHIKGAREHNLKDLELRLPRGQLIVVTGVSGSGKSSLAFDTLYAEGYRIYMDSLSTRARQVLDQIKRPDVDFIHGLSPVIAIEQRTGGGNPRSTVGTVTEIADYARLVWSLGGEQFCPLDGGRIERRSLDDCIDRVFTEPEGTRLMLLAPYLESKPALAREELPRLRQRGFTRLRVNGEIRLIDDDEVIPSGVSQVSLDIVVDRLVVQPDQRSRLADSLELAMREGGDQALALFEQKDGTWKEVVLSQSLSCAKCGTVYEPLTTRHFSYNHPEGACATCGGLGRTLQFNEDLIVPDVSKSVKNGAIKPWRLGSKAMIIKRNALLKQLAEQLPFDANAPWEDLAEDIRQQILHGAGERQFSFKLRPGNTKPETMPFAGVIADLEQTRRETSSDGLKARLTAYQISSICPDCQGQRFNPRALNVRVGGRSIADFLGQPVERGLDFIAGLMHEPERYAPVMDALRGLQQRLHFLNEVGIGYLSIDRQYSTLSGGEAQRVRLASQLGLGLTGVLYVLDEPSIGLHPIDTRRLVHTMRDLRDRGNTVIVVEHDEETMRAADHLLELGPGAGTQGGTLVFTGTPEACARSPKSRTGPYLAGTKRIERDYVERSPDRGWMTVLGARENNLKKVDVSFPLGCLTVVCGVSGSGKSTLVNDILAEAAAFKLNKAKRIPGAHDGIQGLDAFKVCVIVDQEPIGRSPRSNPATYVKLFDLLRTLYANCPLSKVRGYKPNRFSFNVRGGRCERCQGDGAVKLDMQFLGDVFTECPSCHGQRYNRETLEVRFKGLNIAEVLDLTVEEALAFFRNQPKILEKLQTLDAVGLSYLKLGQAANTLSGGEAQRIKLSLELSRRQQGQTLYILDEPTTGLHFDDVQKLINLLFQLREAGNTIIIIEHDLDVIRTADWVVELGPGGGSAGGEVVYTGDVAGLLRTEESITAQCLREQTCERENAARLESAGIGG